MEKFLTKVATWLEIHFLPIAGKIAAQRHLAAMRDGFIAILPIGMAGAAVVMLKEVIFADTSLLGATLNKMSFYHSHIQPLWDTSVVPLLNQIWWGTLALGVIFSVFTISYHLAKTNQIDPLSAGVVATIAYLIQLPQAAEGADWGTISWTSFNSEAIFTGLIVAFFSTELFTFAVRRGWLIKMPEQVPSTVSKAFSAVIPAGLVFFVCGIISVTLQTRFDTILQVVIHDAIQLPLVNLGQSPFTLLLLILIQQILWFFGLHGANIIGPFLDAMYSPSLSANAEAILVHGTAAPHAITRNIIDIYGMHGGAGATLALIVALLMFGRRKEHHELAKLSLAPGIFQINEPMIYGLPIVLNPLMFIPFLIIPPLTIFIGWFFTAIIPLAGPIYISPPWVTPPIISAFLATGGSLGATLIAALNFALAVIIYAPFVILLNKPQTTQL